MIVVGSVRPGRIGLPIAQWVQQSVEHDWQVDFADLAEIDLPFMDEPSHPSKREYTQQHTIEWSKRVDAADAVILVTPEYNHSFSPALKNALDYLSQEWWRKPVGFVSYGGTSGGTRGVAVLQSVIAVLGMVRAASPVEINYASKQVADGVFTPTDKDEALLRNQLADLENLAVALRRLQNR